MSLISQAAPATAARGTAGPFAALFTAVLSFSLMRTSPFLLTSSVATGVLGRLGDMFGKRRLLLASVAVFAAGTLLAAVAGSIPAESGYTKAFVMSAAAMGVAAVAALAGPGRTLRGSDA